MLADMVSDAPTNFEHSYVIWELNRKQLTFQLETSGDPVIVIHSHLSRKLYAWWIQCFPDCCSFTIANGLLASLEVLMKQLIFLNISVHFLIFSEVLAVRHNLENKINSLPDWPRALPSLEHWDLFAS